MKIEERIIRTTSSESRVEETSLLLVTHELDQCIECQRLCSDCSSTPSVVLGRRLCDLQLNIQYLITLILMYKN